MGRVRSGLGRPPCCACGQSPKRAKASSEKNPRTTCSKRSTRPRCRCVPRRERRDPKPCLDGPARLQRQNTPARPRMSLTATAPSPASSPRAALERVRRRRHRRRARRRKGTPPPRRFPIGPSLPVDAPRSSPTVQPGGSDPSSKKKSPLADSAPRGARFADPPSSECAGREQRFRRHVGVAQQGQAVQGHDHPRAE